MNIEKALNNLTTQEKLKLLTGKNSWQTEDLGGKLPAVFMADGPNGLRKQNEDGSTHKNTAYPTLSMLGCSFNVETARKVGDAIAEDCIENGVDVLLAPGINMKRTPLCGRNFEYFSEDPVLSGHLACGYIEGVQSRGVGTSLKHFAANNNENYRFYQNAEVDERAFYELYTKAFEIALKAKPWTVMCSYNLVNGIYASENPKLLKGILRDKFGFNGLIVSDWSACMQRAKALKATLDLEMPYSDSSYGELEKAYRDGFISDAEIDSCVKRILELIDKSEKAKPKRKVQKTKEERHRIAVEAAEDCIVLLKNDNSILPLKGGCSIDVYHSFSSSLYGGGGSSRVETENTIVRIDEVLRSRGENVTVYAQPVYPSNGEYCIVCVGNTPDVECEGCDRESISLSDRLKEMILKCAEYTPNTIVLVYAGSAIDMSKWIDKVAAVLYVGYCGEGANEATANILLGKISPSGKLAESFPIDLQSNPIDKSTEFAPHVYYKERFDIGYRYYDKYPEKVRFPFGYGLSYADFVYENAEIEKSGETEYTVRFILKNQSNIDAKEITQIYVQDVFCTSERPRKELKAFTKTHLKAGESKTVEVKLDRSAFAYYNSSLNDWYVENGRFNIYVATSSQDIKATLTVDVCLDDYTQYTAKNTKLL